MVRPPNRNGARSRMAEAAQAGEPLRPMAGCTDIMVDANSGRLKWRRFVDLWGLRFVLGELEWALHGAVDPGSNGNGREAMEFRAGGGAGPGPQGSGPGRRGPRGTPRTIRS